MKWSLSMRYQRLLCAIACGLLGACAALLTFEVWTLFADDGLLPPVLASAEATLYFLFCTLGALLGILFTRPIAKTLQKKIVQLSALLSRAPAGQLLSAIVGLIIGLVLALLGSQLFNNFRPSSVGSALSVVLYIVLGSLGATVGAKRYQEWPLEKLLPATASKNAATDALTTLLDTSALIDGRVLAICRAGFLRGTFILPADVLTELRHIAGDSDPQRRARGRFGLDSIETLKTLPGITVRLDETTFPDIPEVDARLVRLALQTGAQLLSTDAALCKIAAVAGVHVLRVNALAAALKPVFLPGETLSLTIQREGTADTQGVGFLPDGTMVIVDGARERIGAEVSACVTRTLPTSTGQMVFATLLDGQ